MSKRALLVVPTTPAKAGNGLAMRAGLLHEGLSAAFDVDVLVVPVFEAGRTTNDGAVAEFTRALGTPAGRERARALHPLPSLCRAVTTDVRNQIVEQAAVLALIVVMREYLAPALDGVLDLPSRPPIVLDVDDIESDTQGELGNAEQSMRFEQLERHYLPLVDVVLTCSQADADALADRHELRRVAVVPNAVRFPEPGVESPARYDLLFVGTLGYRPNAEAARWLVEDVLPLLGDVRVAIVGRSPGPEVRALADDVRVTVAGDVVEIAPWYAASRVVVVPVRRGGGSAIKLIEGLAFARPVVSTRAGARGLAWAEGASAIAVADAADGFASACRALLDDPGLARELGTEGRRLAAEHASVDVVAARISELAAALAALSARSRRT